MVLQEMCKVDDQAGKNFVWLKPIGIISLTILLVSVFAIVGVQLYTGWQDDRNCQDRVNELNSKLQEAKNKNFQLNVKLQAAEKDVKDLQSKLQEAVSEKNRLSGNLNEARDQVEEKKRALIVSDVQHLNNLLKLALFTIAVLAAIMFGMVWFACRRKSGVYVTQGPTSKGFLMIAAGSDH